MNINDVLNIILPIVLICLVIAIIIFVVELIRTVKTARTTITDIKTQVDPLLTEANTMLTNIQPAVSKVDPLLERVQLTVDSVNLEMMRVDQILEDVSEITDTASSATAAVDNIANAPLKAVNSVALKVRGLFGDKDASAESTRLAEQKAQVDKAEQEQQAQAAKAQNRENLNEDEAVLERKLNLDGYLSNATGEPARTAGGATTASALDGMTSAAYAEEAPKQSSPANYTTVMTGIVTEPQAMPVWTAPGVASGEVSRTQRELDALHAEQPNAADPAADQH